MPTQQSDTFSKNHLNENVRDELYIHLAASHVDDAIGGRGRFGKAHAFFKTKALKRSVVNSKEIGLFTS